MKLIGLARLGRDAELRYTPDGTAVASMSLAYDYGGKERQTQWVEASMWGDRAEKITQYLTKGKLLLVSLDGPHIDVYQKKDGTTGSKLTARVIDVEFAGAAPDAAPAVKPPVKAKTPVAAIAGMDDDLPF